MLQCLWNSTMCAMCFYELIKAAFEAMKQNYGGRDNTRETREDWKYVKGSMERDAGRRRVAVVFC